MSRWVLAMAFLVACGRRGFDEPRDASALDATADAVAADASGGVLVLRPIGAGAFTEWNIADPAATEHWDLIDEPDPPDDNGTMVRTSAAGLKDTYVHASSGLPASTVIDHIEVIARAWSPQGWTIQLLIRSPTFEAAGPTLTLTDTWTYYSQAWATNPGTGAAWTVAQIDVLEIGANAISASSFFEPSITQMWLTVVSR
jgi:hypothetical protein